MFTDIMLFYLVPVAISLIRYWLMINKTLKNDIKRYRQTVDAWNYDPDLIDDWYVAEVTVGSIVQKLIAALLPVMNIFITGLAIIEFCFFIHRKILSTLDIPLVPKYMGEK